MYELSKDRATIAVSAAFRRLVKDGMVLEDMFDLWPEMTPERIRELVETKPPWVDNFNAEMRRLYAEIMAYPDNVARREHVAQVEAERKLIKSLPDNVVSLAEYRAKISRGGDRTAQKEPR